MVRDGPFTYTRVGIWFAICERYRPNSPAAASPTIKNIAAPFGINLKNSSPVPF